MHLLPRRGTDSCSSRWEISCIDAILLVSFRLAIWSGQGRFAFWPVSGCEPVWTTTKDQTDRSIIQSRRYFAFPLFHLRVKFAKIGIDQVFFNSLHVFMHITRKVAPSLSLWGATWIVRCIEHSHLAGSAMRRCRYHETRR